MTLFFGDFEVGDEHVTPARTVTEADVVLFAGISGDFNPIHTDEEFARATNFGGRIAHGLLGVAMTSGLLARLGLFDGSGLAFLEMEWSFTGPIHIGDTIHVIQRVEETRPTSRDDRGVVEFSLEVVNQDEETVQRGRRRLLLATRNPG